MTTTQYLNSLLNDIKKANDAGDFWKSEHLAETYLDKKEEYKRLKERRGF